MQKKKKVSLFLFPEQYSIHPALSVKPENVGAREMGGVQHLSISDVVGEHSTEHSEKIIGLDHHLHVHRWPHNAFPPTVTRDTLSYP